jgi:hypothetical protein
MKLLPLSALLLALATPVAAQDRSADEKAIRDIVAKVNAGVPPPTDYKPLRIACSGVARSCDPKWATTSRSFDPGRAPVHGAIQRPT